MSSLLSCPRKKINHQTTSTWNKPFCFVIYHQFMWQNRSFFLLRVKTCCRNNILIQHTRDTAKHISATTYITPFVPFLKNRHQRFILTGCICCSKGNLLLKLQSFVFVCLFVYNSSLEAVFRYPEEPKSDPAIGVTVYGWQVRDTQRHTSLLYIWTVWLYKA